MAEPGGGFSENSEIEVSRDTYFFHENKQKGNIGSVLLSPEGPDRTLSVRGRRRRNGQRHNNQYVKLRESGWTHEGDDDSGKDSRIRITFRADTEEHQDYQR